MYDVTAIGELLIDFAARGNNSVGYPIMEANPGGAPANFLAALNAYGRKTAFIGKVGNDAFGNLLVGTLKDAGIDTKGIVMADDVFTTLAFVTFDETGDRDFSFARKPGADTRLTEDEIDKTIIDESSVLHFGTLSLTNEPAKSACKAAVEYAKSQGKLITFDPNWRAPLWPSAEAGREQIIWGLNHADAVKISDEEVELVWGCTPEEGLDKLLNECGVKLAWVTLGAEGCLFGNKNGRGYVKYNGELNVTDTTGAGDIFGGSAVCGLLNSGKAPETLTAEEQADIAAFACAAASLSTEHAGGIVSVRPMDEIKNNISEVSVRLVH